MLKILQQLKLENLKISINSIFSRFPLSAIISIAAFLLMLTFIRLEDSLTQSNEEIILNVFTALVITFFFSIAIYLLAESKQVEAKVKPYFQLTSLIFGSLFYYFFEEGLFSGNQVEAFVYMVLTIIGVMAFLFIAKYFKKFKVVPENQNEFYTSSYALVIKTIMSGIVGVSALILGMIALQSVFVLFEIEFIKEGNWYAYWTSFSLILFMPFFFLANLPTIKDDKNTHIDQISSNKFFSFLVNYIGLPAILIYFVILYTYTIKVLINFSEWPHGEVAWMVILFSFFGYIVYLASFAFQQTLKLIRIFRKTLPIVILLQIPMLFYAIGLRIYQYDFTINRYLVVIFGIWLLFLSLYYILSKQKSLHTSFYSLLVTVILISIGPWSVYVMPEQRQLTILEKNLKTANILQDKEIVPLESYKDIDAKLGSEIYEGIKYLTNFHGYATLENLFTQEIKEIKKEDKESFQKNKKDKLDRLAKDSANEDIIKKAKESNYNGLNNAKLVNDLTKLIKVGRFSSYNQGEESKYWRFENTSGRAFGSSIAISDYEYYVPLIQNKNEIDYIVNNQNNEYDIEEEVYFAIINSEKEKISLYQNSTLLEEVDIKASVFDKILNNQENHLEPKHQERNLKAMLKNKHMSFVVKGEIFDMLVVLQSITVPNPNWTKNPEIKNVPNQDALMIPKAIQMPRYSNGYVLIRNKAPKDTP